MRTEGNPLDLNNFPEDYSKQAIEDTSSSAGHRKKRSGGKDGKDESGKVYECRFCSLKFCKSQALGGHMNRHRQERETETLNRARQLVFSTDNLAAQAAHHHHLAGAQPIPHGVYHQAANIGRPIYPPPRLFSGSSALLAPLPPPPPPPHQPFLYPSPPLPPPRHISYSSQYPPPNDYYIGHVLPGNSHYPSAPPTTDTNYTCIGAPVGHAFPGTSSGGAEQDMGAPGHRRINAFQEGF